MPNKRIASLTLFAFVFALPFCMGCGKKKEDAKAVEEMPDLLAEENTAAGDSMGTETTLDELEKEAASGSKAAKNHFAESPAPAAFSGQFDPAGRYVVQVSASKSEEASNGMAEKLKGSGYPAYVTPVENPTPDLLGTFYRVRIGNFRTVAEARAFGGTISGSGYAWWADYKENDNAAPAAPESRQNEGAASGSEGSWKTESAAPVTPPPAVPSTPETPPPAVDWGATTPAPSSPPATPPPSNNNPGGTSGGSDSKTPSGTTDEWGTGTGGSGSGW